MTAAISLVDCASAMPARLVDNTFFTASPESGMFKGTKERYHLGRDESATNLIVQAAHKLSSRLGFQFAKDVDLILTNVSLPDCVFTGCGASVSKRLGCKPKWILDLHNSGCISFVYMMAVAREMMATGVIKTALICSAQTAAGRVFAQEENRGRAQSMIPGDGCGVGYVVANASSPFRSIVQRSYGDYADDMILVNDENRQYWEARQTSMHIDFTEGKMADIVSRGNAIVPQIIGEACTKAEIGLGEIDFLITNQPNPIFLRNWREALQIPKERQIETFAEHGNLFGAAIPISIERGIHSGKLAKGSRVALGGFAHAGDYAAAAIWQVGA